MLLQGCLQCNTEAASPLCALASYFDGFLPGQAVLVEQIRTLLAPEMERAGMTGLGDIWEMLNNTEFSELRTIASKAAADPSHALEPLLDSVKAPMVAKIQGLAGLALEDADEVISWVGELLVDCKGTDIFRLLQVAGTDPQQMPSQLVTTLAPSIMGKLSSWESAQGALRLLSSLIMKLPIAAMGAAAGALFQEALTNAPMLLAVPLSAICAILVCLKKACDRTKDK